MLCHGDVVNERRSKADAPLLLGFESHPINRVNLKPRPGVFWGRFKYLPWSRDRLGPIKVPVNGPSGEVSAV